MEEIKKLEIATQFRQLAELNFQKQNCSDACFFYINCLKIIPAWKNEIKKNFLISLSTLGQLLEKKQQFSEIFTLYEEALFLYNDSEEVHHNLGAHLLRLGYPDKATFYFRASLKCNKNYFPALRSLHSSYCALVERWHYRMLNDSYRNQAYREAIHRKIKQGFNTVLDIGTGTGLLSLYAVEAKAQKVYACECNPIMLTIASQVFSENSVNVTLINRHSNEIKINQDMEDRVSLIITETMDCCMLGERILETLVYAWKYLLQPPYKFDGDKPIVNNNLNGFVIPSSGSLWFSIVQSKLLAKNYIFPLLSNDVYDDYMEAFSNISLKDFTDQENFKDLKINNIELYAFLNEPYDTERLQLLNDCIFLTEPQELFNINFNNPQEIEKYLLNRNRTMFDIICTREGYLHAVVAWFKIHLDENTVLCSSPFDLNSKDCCWDQAIFPSTRSFHIVPGSKITLLSDWAESKVTFAVTKIMQPNAQVFYNEPVPEIAPPGYISLLNDNYLLMHLKNAAVKCVERCHKMKNVRILDFFPIPIVGLTILRNSHLIHRIVDIELVCVIHSQEEIVVITKIAEYNEISISTLTFIMADDFNKLYTVEKYFDIIIINLIDSQGDFNEDIINQIDILKSLLKCEGFFLPEKIEICGQLIYSDFIERNMRVMNIHIHQSGISHYINEYQVSQMSEINVATLDFEKYSDVFTCNRFSLNDLNSELTNQLYVSVIRDGIINSILCWYNVSFLENDVYSTYHEFSYVHQLAYLMKNARFFHKNDNVMIEFMYHYGTFIIKVKNSEAE